MKILFISHSCGVAGAERSLAELVRAAVNMGHSGWVMLPQRGPLEDLLPASGTFSTQRYPAGNWVGNRSSGVYGVLRLVQCIISLPTCLRLLVKLRPDVVIINSSVSPCFALAAYILRVPVAVIVRESIFDNPRLKSVLSAPLRRRLLMRWTRRSIVAVSKFVAKDWPGAAWVWPPIEGKYLNRGACQRVQDPPRPGVAARIAMVGTVDPLKGQQDFVQSVHLVMQTNLRVEVWIAGGGTESDVSALRTAIDSLEVPVKFTSDWIDASEVFDWCDFSVVCSTAEAFGKVTVESLLCGKPVVAYGCGGTVEIAELGGVSLIEPSVGHLAREIARLSTRPDLLEGLRSEILPDELVTRLGGNAERAVRACLSAVASGH